MFATCVSIFAGKPNAFGQTFSTVLMPLLTANDLRSFSNVKLSADAQSRTFSKGFLNESFAKTNPAVSTVFLSHSHTDSDYVAYAVQLLRSIGVYVYVDWQDASMPKTTSGETANKLKERIRVCKKFVMLASPSAIKSNWVNWEIGYGDAHKHPGRNLAILPFVPDSQSGWPDAEYLEIYPYIDQETVRSSSAYYATPQTTYYVNFPNKTRVKLADWLNS